MPTHGSNRGAVVSLVGRREAKQHATEREQLAREIHWLMGSLETYLSETLTATFHPAHGGWTDRPPLTLDQLRELEARLRGIETELTALREEE
jgi:hypothetical protein